MDSYLGRNTAFGLFEKQYLTIQAGVTDYQLIWKVGSASSLLVVTNNTILEPNYDYEVTIDGQTLTFTNIPNPVQRTYVVYLGRELSVARVAGIAPVLETFVGDGANQQFILANNASDQNSLIVFVNGVQKIYTTDFTISSVNVLGHFHKAINFTFIPALNANISVYVHGVERFDSNILESDVIINDYIADNSIQNRNILANSITGDKMNSGWIDFSGSLSLQTFHGMTISGSPIINVAKYKLISSTSIEMKLDIICQFSGTADNRLRVQIPFGQMIDEICVGNVGLSTTGLDETGLIKLGGVTFCDIMREDGVNYTLGTAWRFKVRTTYDTV